MSLRPDVYYLMEEPWSKEREASDAMYSLTTATLGFGYKNPHFNPRTWLCYDKEAAKAFWMEHCKPDRLRHLPCSASVTIVRRGQGITPVTDVADFEKKGGA